MFPARAAFRNEWLFVATVRVHAIAVKHESSYPPFSAAMSKQVPRKNQGLNIYLY